MAIGMLNDRSGKVDFIGYFFDGMWSYELEKLSLKEFLYLEKYQGVTEAEEDQVLHFYLKHQLNEMY